MDGSTWAWWEEADSVAFLACSWDIRDSQGMGFLRSAYRGPGKPYRRGLMRERIGISVEYSMWFLKYTLHNEAVSR